VTAGRHGIAGRKGAALAPLGARSCTLLLKVSVKLLLLLLLLKFRGMHALLSKAHVSVGNGVTWRPSLVLSRKRVDDCAALPSSVLAKRAKPTFLHPACRVVGLPRTLLRTTRM
jgi:hypothetical protein